MRVIVIGLGTQGKKRSAVAGSELVCTVDPVNPAANYTDLKKVPLDSFDAAMVCTPEEAKVEILNYLLKNKKHVLVEKPLMTETVSILKELKQLAEQNKVALYTAYNHRFEPHIVNLKNALNANELGTLYQVNLFYGNGTARDVRNSVWRDKGSGVLTDLGSHLLDTICYLFGDHVSAFEKRNFSTFENKAYDHVTFATSDSYKGRPAISMEATMLSWKNTFRLDLLAEFGSAHIEGLCKWGPSTLTLRKRIIPSGVPTEISHVLKCPDPTWQLEYEYFKRMAHEGKNNTDVDIWILKTLSGLEGKNL